MIFNIEIPFFLANKIRIRIYGSGSRRPKTHGSGSEKLYRYAKNQNHTTLKEKTKTEKKCLKTLKECRTLA
jgi:hypothetical protein